MNRDFQYHMQFIRYVTIRNRSRSWRSNASADSRAPCAYAMDVDDDDDDGFDSAEIEFGDDDDYDMVGDEDRRSLCSACSCSQCGINGQRNEKRNPIFGRTELQMSFCER